MPVAHLRQAPLPSHMPSLPQVDGVACVHSLSGSVPFVTGRQRPSARPVFAFTQALQVPVQAVSQQTPSTHWLLAHSVAAAQGLPLPAPLGASAPASASVVPASEVPPEPALPPVPAEPAVPPEPAEPPAEPAVPPEPADPPDPAVPVAPVPPLPLLPPTLPPVAPLPPTLPPVAPEPPVPPLPPLPPAPPLEEGLSTPPSGGEPLLPPHEANPRRLANATTLTNSPGKE